MLLVSVFLYLIVLKELSFSPVNLGLAKRLLGARLRRSAKMPECEWDKVEREALRQDATGCLNHGTPGVTGSRLRAGKMPLERGRKEPPKEILGAGRPVGRLFCVRVLFRPGACGSARCAHAHAPEASWHPAHERKGRGGYVLSVPGTAACRACRPTPRRRPEDPSSRRYWARPRTALH